MAPASPTRTLLGFGVIAASLFAASTCCSAMLREARANRSICTGSWRTGAITAAITSTAASGPRRLFDAITPAPSAAATSSISIAGAA